MIQDPFQFFRFWNSAKPRLMANDIWQTIGLDLVNIKVIQNFIKIFHTVQEKEKEPVSVFQTLDLGHAATDDKCQLAIPWARACEYQCVCKTQSQYYARFKSKGQFLFLFLFCFVFFDCLLLLFFCFFCFFFLFFFICFFFFFFFFFLIMISAKTRPMKNDIWQYFA